MGEKWSLRCPKATSISILSAQIATAAAAAAAGAFPGQERCLNVTYTPKGTSQSQPSRLIDLLIY